MTIVQFYRWGPVVAGLLLLFLIGVALQYATTSGMVSPFVVPPPVDILESVPKLFIKEGLIGYFFVTVGITLSATLISIVIGLPIGWMLFRRPDFGKAYESWLGAIFSAPIILLYPLFLVVLGRGVSTIVVMSVVVGITPIILSTYTGLKGVPPVYLRVAKSFNMASRDMFWKVYAPAALPAIFTGVRLALIYVMINAVAMEFLISIGGLGYLVGDLYDRYNLPEMYAAVIFVVVASIIFFTIIDRTEKWLRRR